MKIRKGQMIDQMADFGPYNPDEAPYTMCRYIVIKEDENDVYLYVVKGYTDEHDRVISDISVPGMIERITKKYIVSKEETVNNFYWEVVSDI